MGVLIATEVVVEILLSGGGGGNEVNGRIDDCCSYDNDGGINHLVTPRTSLSYPASVMKVSFR